MAKKILGFFPCFLKNSNIKLENKAKLESLIHKKMPYELIR